MEALGAAATVSGIIQLAKYGIETIVFLRTALRSCDVAVLTDFLHGLTSSGRLLGDIQDLCRRIQLHPNNNISRICTTSLQLQLEDCVRDLEIWLRIARDLEHRSTTPKSSTTSSSKWAKLGNVLSPSQRSARFMRAATKAVKLVATADTRTAIQERFQQHISNITVALAVFQTHLSFVHIEHLSRVETTAQQLKAITESIEMKQLNSDSYGRGSRESNPAQSMSDEQRLREIETLSSISDKIDRILGVLSSQGSSSSSALSQGSFKFTRENHEQDPVLAPHNPKSAMPNCDHLQLKDKQAQVPKAVLLSDHSDGDADEDDTNSTSRLIADFNLLIEQAFADTIADYISAAERWRLSAIRSRLLEFIATLPNASKIQMDLGIKSDLGHLSASLLALRRRAEAESLLSLLVKADQLLGIDETLISTWELIAEEKRNERTGEQDFVLPANNQANQVAETQIRMDEWFLGVMTADPNLTDFHQRLVSNYVSQLQNIKSSDTIDSEQRTHLNREEWERLTLKFWLIDGSRNISGDYASSLAFTTSRESELTVLAAPEGDFDWDRAWTDLGYEQFDIAQSETSAVFKQPHMTSRPRGLTDTQMLAVSEMPPQHPNTVLTIRAQQALLDYQKSSINPQLDPLS